MKIESVPRAAIEPVLPDLIADQMGIDPDLGTWLAATDDDGLVIGVARVTEVAGVRTIDDIWVAPAWRRHGVATALIEHAGRPLWLICDEDMIGYYEKRGFTLEKEDDFPEELAVLYGARGEWPASDHVHYGMRRR